MEFLHWNLRRHDAASKMVEKKPLGPAQSCSQSPWSLKSIRERHKEYIWQRGAPEIAGEEAALHGGFPGLGRPLPLPPTKGPASLWSPHTSLNTHHRGSANPAGQAHHSEPESGLSLACPHWVTPLWGIWVSGHVACRRHLRLHLQDPGLHSSWPWRNFLWAALATASQGMCIDGEREGQTLSWHQGLQGWVRKG